MQWLIYSMVYLGSALMVYNIYGFIRFARYVRNLRSWNRENHILYIPIILLVCFLIGYLVVGIFGQPDLVIAGILFGGSIFVFIMYKLLTSIIQKVVENERLQAQLLAAEESNRTKTRFLASMSHEMRTPMNVIIGQDTIALKDDSLKPKTRERLEKINISAHHLLEIINDVLDMNYIESDAMQLRDEPFSLGEVLKLVDMLAQDRCEEKRIEYRSETVGDTDILCAGDSLRLRQVLVAVLDNAIKFTPAGGSIAFITEQQAEGDAACRLRFTIRDTGVGIDRDFISKIFDTFSQEDAGTTNRYGGSGLGLAIVKKLVDMMNGEIAVESEKGKGSAFTITLRLETRTEAPEPTSAAAPANVDLAGRHILVAEDMDLNAEMIADLLTLEGMTSERAENGQQAVERFAGSDVGRFDAILMDMRMPVMDGLSAARRIRGLDRRDAGAVPIVALTANTSDDDIRQSLQAGMDVHLSKPVNAEQLYDTLRRLLAGRRDPAANQRHTEDKGAM